MNKYIDITKASNEAKLLIGKEISLDLKEGKTLVFPTETVYGLACDMLNTKAVESIFDIKGRDHTKPLPIMIGNIDHIHYVARDIPKVFFELAEKYMPGPLTVILKKKENISDIITGGKDTVGVRMPDHFFALNMIKEVAHPIIATSANLSGKPSPINFEMAKNDLEHKVDIFINEGDCVGGTPSTIIDLSGDKIKILRQGDLNLDEYCE